MPDSGGAPGTAMRILVFLKRWFLRFAATLGVVFLAVTLSPVVFWWATALAGPWNDPSGDVLIVLTGSGLEDGTLGMSSYWRGVYVLRFFKNENFNQVLISGTGPGVPAAVEMRNFVVAQGVPAAAVRVETASQSTRESALNIARILREEPQRYAGQRLILMTSDYHMFRSHRAFQKAGVTVEPRPIPDVRKRYSSPLNRWGLFLELSAESGKIVYYWAHGWI
jgi:uncharacterized SAM-binding protein YcdF (DUF218 family)